jgi:phytoene dehydrogenase-like protein
MKDVAIIGAGLAGLNCALTLQRAGLDVILFEATDAVGGRVHTDEVDGFLLDRGFQVLLTAYPEAQSVLDYSSLGLRELSPGALVWKGGRFHKFADPFREPLAAIRLAFDPIVTLGDKLRVAKLRGRVLSGPTPELFSHDETTTRTYLERFGFSSKVIQCFFEPFFGGVFLEKELVTSSRYFEFLFRMFSTGSAALPARGMRAIPEQLAVKLKPGTLVLNSRVRQLSSQSGSFVLSDGGQAFIAARTVVVATEESTARQLLQGLSGFGISTGARTWNCTTAFCFAADQPPVKGPMLMLNGEGQKAGPVNNAVVLSEVAPSYAPAGGHLISTSVVGQAPSDFCGDQRS